MMRKIITIIANMESTVCLTIISLCERFFFILTIPKARHHFAFQETEAQRDDILDLLWNTYQVMELGL